MTSLNVSVFFLHNSPPRKRAGKKAGEKEKSLYTVKFFLNRVKLNQIWIVITLLRLIYNQTDFRLVLKQSGKGNNNPN